MIRGKESKSKTKRLVPVPDEPVPLQIVNAEAVDCPSSEEKKTETLNREVVPVFGGWYEEEQMTNEVNNEEEEVGLEINDIIVDGNEPVLTNLDEAEKLKDMSDRGDAATAAENGNGRIDEEEPEEDEEPVSCGSDNDDAPKGQEEKRPEVTSCNEELISCGSDKEDVPKGGEEKGPDGTACDQEPLRCGSDNEDRPNGVEEKGLKEIACVTNTNVSLAVSQKGPIEYMSEILEDDKKTNETIAEEPISTPAETGGDESIKENAGNANEINGVAEKVTKPKKKIVKKRLLKRKIPLGKVENPINEAKLHLSDENGASGVSCKASTSNEGKAQCMEDSQGMGEASKEGTTDILKNEEKVEGKTIVKRNRKLNRTRISKPQSQSGEQSGNVEQTPKPTNDEPVSIQNQTIELEINNKEAEKPKDRRIRQRKNKKVEEEGTKNESAMDVDKPGSSNTVKLSKKADSMGMIFMCNSETKKDCYRYKVLGLPAGKKDIVSKIYKGMRLFLFDIDLKMLYGIYKAAGAGSYNVEPKAFKSQYPSQVRFTILEDCLPLAEEKFKKVIKDNYYTKNKFDCQLNSEQVKNLCKLFSETTKKAESIRGGRNQKALLSTSSIRGDRKRKRAEDSRRVKPGALSSLEHGRRRKDREEVSHAPISRGQEDLRRAIVLREQDERRRAIEIRDRDERRRAIEIRDQEEMRRAIEVRGREEIRRAPVAIDERYRRPVVYDREAFLPSVTSSTLYQPLRAEETPRTRIYSFERDPIAETYRRDTAVEYRDLGVLGYREPRPYAERSVHDPYGAYREPRYQERVYDTETHTRQEHYDYPSTERRYDAVYRSDEYRPPLPLHRRY